MADGESATDAMRSVDHERAAAAFIGRIRETFDDVIVSIILFGSTVRGEAEGLSSDVDVMVVLDNDAPFDRTADALRDVAYDVMLEYGPVVELHVVEESAYERSLAEEQPFVRNVVREGIAYGG